MYTQREKSTLGKQFFRYALPAVIGMVVSSLYTVVDGIMVGRGVGSTALGAVNIVYPFIMLQIALSMLIAIGGANMYSMALGAGKRDEAQSLFSQSLWLLIGLSFVANLCALLFAEPLCTLLGADAELLPHSVEYLRVIALFGFAYMPGLGISIFLRNDGAPHLEMIGTLAGAISNIALDYLFIMVYGWGLWGAAVATGIGQMISMAVFLSHFLRKKCTLRFSMPKFRKKQIKSLLYNGLPSFLMEFSQSAVAMSFNMALIRSIGVDGVAAYSVVMYICSIFNMVLIGIVQGAQPLMSFNHGMGAQKNVLRIRRMAVCASLALTALFYGVILLWGGPLSSLFIDDNSTITNMALTMMLFYFLGFFPVGISLVNILYFQTTRQERPSILISLLRCLGFVQLALLTLPLFLGTTGIYLAFLTGEALNCGLSIVLYERYRRKAALPQAVHT